MGEVHQPRDLFLRLLGDILYVERRLAGDVIEKLRQAAKDDELRDALAEHLEQTRNHVRNAEAAFRDTGAEPTALRSAAFEGLVSQHDDDAAEISQPAVADAFHAAAAAHTEHYELAAYEALIPLADELDFRDARKRLEDSRDDEAAALRRVEKIANRLTKDATS